MACARHIRQLRRRDAIGKRIVGNRQPEARQLAVAFPGRRISEIAAALALGIRLDGKVIARHLEKLEVQILLLLDQPSGHGDR